MSQKCKNNTIAYYDCFNKEIFIDITKDKRYYRFTFISENLYKNPELKRAKNTSVLHYQPDSRDGKIELSDVRKWFEEYKKTLSPYLSEYQKVKSEMVKVEQKLEAVAQMDQINCPCGLLLEDVLVQTHIASSKREAREWIKGNSIAINGTKVTDPLTKICIENCCVKDFMILKRGKKNYYCVKLEESDH